MTISFSNKVFNVIQTYFYMKGFETETKGNLEMVGLFLLHALSLAGELE